MLKNRHSYADTAIEDSEVFGMKLLETSAVSNVSVSRALHEQVVIAEVVNDDRSTSKSYTSDEYVGVAANDAVFTKALNSALSDYMPTSKQAPLASQNDNNVPPSLYERRPNDAGAELAFASVLSSIESTIKSLTAHGASIDAINSLKEQAIKGIEQGYSKAERELEALTGETFSENFLQTKESLVDSVIRLSVREASDTPISTEQNSTFTMELLDGQKIDVTFGLARHQDNTEDLIFTTNNNNVSLSITGALTDETNEKVIQAVNAADRLVSAFFNSDIEQLFDSLINNGYTRNTITNDPQRQIDLELKSNARRYLQIAELGNEKTTRGNEIAHIRDYKAQLSETVKLADSIFASQNQHKEIINGLINQIHDVQVPDLLSAINKIHAFNARLV